MTVSLQKGEHTLIPTSDSIDLRKAVKLPYSIHYTGASQPVVPHFLQSGGRQMKA